MKTTALLLLAVLTITPAFAAEFPAVEGWDPAGEAMTFSPTTLWEHINGAAETFLQYGFQGLATAELSHGDVTVAVGVYDMGSPLNAYGIYRTEAPEDAETQDIGAQAVISPPYQCLLAKDRFYVKVDVYDGELDAETGRAIVTAIAAALPGKDGMPEEFSKLPSKGRIPGSERFTREAFLGLRELTNCVSAEYSESDETDYRVFVMLPQAGEKTDTQWSALAGKWKAVSHDGLPVLTKQVPYTGLVGVTNTTKGVVGTVGGEEEAALLKRLSALASGG